MFGVSLLSPATSLARSAVEAKVRTTAREQLVARAAAPNGRATASRITIVGVESVVKLRSAAGEGVRW
jgi:hypothetical protein